MNYSLRTFFFCTTATICFAATATARDTWTGVVSSHPGTTTRVDAIFGERRISLHFDEPANCTLSATLLEHEEEAAYYRFHPSTNGGSFCTRLYPGEVTVISPSPGDKMLTFLRGDTFWSGALTPSAMP